ncbi:hypothetical protein CKAN_01576900 [Cinnamomum micranthum f. kanehirae]|uniref:Protein CYCLOPS n=1 Tax=Cinnamomum micranthum f. kanehirae TaxID=337451 RepID=A0A3S3NUK6_9MAGN|nr:hypothetical protein CKAN_01576900 [Cinnamomum micranthum f. kanehirae]
MIENGNGKELKTDYFQNTGSGSSNQNPNPVRSQSSQSSDPEKNFMEMEGRVYSDLYRNSSEELFLKSLMESSIGMAAPNMETLGFKNLSQTLRVDSQELFNNWLTNGEASDCASSPAGKTALVSLNYSLSEQMNHSNNSTSIAHRTRQASRRISTELAALSSQQHVASSQNRSSNDNIFQQNLGLSDEMSGDCNQRSLRNAVEKGMQASNMYLAKAWFQSSQPMTRSRSSELRRRYAAMQSIQTPSGMDATHDTTGRAINRTKQEFSNASGFCDVSMTEMSNQLRTFMSASNSSSSPFNTTQMATVDAVSSVVSLLKGTLERKKFGNHIDKEAVGGSCFSLFDGQDILANMNSAAVNQILEPSGSFQMVPPVQMTDSGNLQTIDESLGIAIECLVAPTNPVQMATISQEPSQSESSAAAPVPSSGLEACDGPASSGQTPSVCESTRKHVGNENVENSSKTKEFRERMFENNIKDDRKKGNLARVGSLTSCGSGNYFQVLNINRMKLHALQLEHDPHCNQSIPGQDNVYIYWLAIYSQRYLLFRLLLLGLTRDSCAVDKGDPTKKRRVERSRKMAEAKERNLSPAVPSDMQTILKRCDNLEKEVRSLKLNLSFMNRKDSEQTKQIEELQKQNEDLMDEKERLVEEIERIISHSG